MYDRAIIVERGRGAKTNFPLHDYEEEIADFETFMETRCARRPLNMGSGLNLQWLTAKRAQEKHRRAA